MSKDALFKDKMLVMLKLPDTDREVPSIVVRGGDATLDLKTLRELEVAPETQITLHIHPEGKFDFYFDVRVLRHGVHAGTLTVSKPVSGRKEQVRAHPRAEVRLEARMKVYERPDILPDCTILDISAGGMKIVAPGSMRPEYVLHFDLSFGEGYYFSDVLGQVNETFPPATIDGKPRRYIYGIRFVGTTEEDVKRLDAFVGSQKK